MASSVFSPLLPPLRLPASCGTRSTAVHALSVDNAAAATPAAPLAVVSHRRELVVGTALGALFSRAPLSAEAREVEAGKYLPPAPSSPGFVFFKATTKDTPALRAGDHSVLTIFVHNYYPLCFRQIFNLIFDIDDISFSTNSRQCGALRVHPAAHLEAAAGGQHSVRQLLPAQVRGAVGGGEVRGRQAGQSAGGGLAADPPHQQAQRHHRGHRQPREADRLPGAFRHGQHLGARRDHRDLCREDRRPNLLQLCVGDSTGADRFSQSGQGHGQGEYGGALRRERQRQAVAVVGKSSEGHGRLVSSMIAGLQ